jgi:hypothetical protein
MKGGRSTASVSAQTDSRSSTVGHRAHPPRRPRVACSLRHRPAPKLMRYIRHYNKSLGTVKWKCADPSRHVSTQSLQSTSSVADSFRCLVRSAADSMPGFAGLSFLVGVNASSAGKARSPPRGGDHLPRAASMGSGSAVSGSVMRAHRGLEFARDPRLSFGSRIAGVVPLDNKAFGPGSSP